MTQIDFYTHVEDKLRTACRLAAKACSAELRVMVCCPDGELASRFDRMLWIAVTVAMASSALGTIISFHIDAATGACIVLVQAAAFVLAFLFAPKHGLISVRRAERGEPGPSLLPE